MTALLRILMLCTLVFVVALAFAQVQASDRHPVGTTGVPMGSPGANLSDSTQRTAEESVAPLRDGEIARDLPLAEDPIRTGGKPAPISKDGSRLEGEGSGDTKCPAGKECD